MKRYLKSIGAVLLCAALVLGVLCAVPGASTKANAAGNTTDLLATLNGNFESYGIPNWTVSGGAAQYGDLVYGTGDYSLRLPDSNASDASYAVSDKVSVTAGKMLTVSAQVSGGAAGELSVLFYNASDAELTAQTVSVTTATPAATWQLLTKDFVVPADAVKAAVKVSTTAAGTEDVYFDEVALKPYDPRTFVPEIVNPSFETAQNGNAVVGWTNRGAAGTTFAQVDLGNGNHGLQVTKASNAGYSFRMNRTDIIGGLAYTFSIKVKTNSDDSGCQAYMYFYDDNSATPNTALINPPTHSYMILKGDYSSEFAEIKITGLAPVNATSMDILLTDAAKNGRSAIFDDAKLSLAFDLLEPSFEGAAGSSGMPVGWTPGSSTVISNTDTTYIKTGNKSLGTNSASWIYSNYFNIDGGETYEAKIYTKRHSAYTDEALASLYLYYYDNTGAQVGAASGVVEPVSSGWTEIVASKAAPSNAVAARLMVYKPRGSGTVYFDDASFVKKTNNASDDREINNNFPGRNWLLSSTAYQHHLTTAYTDAAHGYSMRMEERHTLMFWTDAIAVTPGATYTTSAQAIGTGRFQVYLRFYAAATDSAHDFLTTNGSNQNGGGTDLGKFKTSSVLNSTTWTAAQTAACVAPSNANYARVWLVALHDGATTPNGPDLYIDNAMLMQELPASTSTATSSTAGTTATTAPATTAPATTAPATTAPATTAPATTAPATTAPATTAPATTAPATTAPATTAPATTAGTTAGTTSATTPETGDSTNVTGMLAILLLAVTGMVAMLVGNKKGKF